MRVQAGSTGKYAALYARFFKLCSSIKIYKPNQSTHLNTIVVYSTFVYLPAKFDMVYLFTLVKKVHENYLP